MQNSDLTSNSFGGCKVAVLAQRSSESRSPIGVSHEVGKLFKVGPNKQLIAFAGPLSSSIVRDP